MAELPLSAQKLRDAGLRIRLVDDELRLTFDEEDRPRAVKVMYEVAMAIKLPDDMDPGYPAQPGIPARDPQPRAARFFAEGKKPRRGNRPDDL
jgi:hypothetical protein